MQGGAKGLKVQHHTSVGQNKGSWAPQDNESTEELEAGFAVT